MGSLSLFLLQVLDQEIGAPHLEVPKAITLPLTGYSTLSNASLELKGLKCHFLL